MNPTLNFHHLKSITFDKAMDLYPDENDVVCYARSLEIEDTAGNRWRIGLFAETREALMVRLPDDAETTAMHDAAVASDPRA